MSKWNLFLTANMFTLMRRPLDNPRGKHGGSVAQDDHAGGALGLLQPSRLPDLVPACQTDKVAVAADRHRTPLPGHGQAHWALHKFLQVVHRLSQLPVLLLQLLETFSDMLIQFDVMVIPRPFWWSFPGCRNHFVWRLSSKGDKELYFHLMGRKKERKSTPIPRFESE